MTYFECPRSTSGPVWPWTPLWVWADVAAQRGRGTGFCVLAKTAMAPLLVESAAFFTSCKSPWFALLRPFRQCIVMRRAECLIIQDQFIFSPGADLQRNCYLKGPGGFKSRDCFIGGGGGGRRSCVHRH